MKMNHMFSGSGKSPQTLLGSRRNAIPVPVTYNRTDLMHSRTEEDSFGRASNALFQRRGLDSFREIEPRFESNLNGVESSYTRNIDNYQSARKSRLINQRDLQEERERRLQEERESRLREERERRLQEERERRLQEERERRLREERERRLKEERERRLQEERERLFQEERERLLQQERERLIQEERERILQEERERVLLQEERERLRLKEKRIQEERELQRIEEHRERLHLQEEREKLQKERERLRLKEEREKRRLKEEREMRHLQEQLDRRPQGQRVSRFQDHRDSRRVQDGRGRRSQDMRDRRHIQDERERRQEERERWRLQERRERLRKEESLKRQRPDSWEARRTESSHLRRSGPTSREREHNMHYEWQDQFRNERREDIHMADSSLSHGVDPEYFEYLQMKRMTAEVERQLLANPIADPQYLLESARPFRQQVEIAQGRGVGRRHEAGGPRALRRDQRRRSLETQYKRKRNRPGGDKKRSIGKLSTRAQRKQLLRDKSPLPEKLWYCHVCPTETENEEKHAEHLESEEHKKNFDKNVEEFKNKVLEMQNKARDDLKKSNRIASLCISCFLPYQGLSTDHKETKKHTEMMSLLHRYCAYCEYNSSTKPEYDKHKLSMSHIKTIRAKMMKKETPDEFPEYEEGVSFGEHMVVKKKAVNCKVCNEYLNVKTPINLHLKRRNHYDSYKKIIEEKKKSMKDARQAKREAASKEAGEAKEGKEETKEDKEEAMEVTDEIEADDDQEDEAVDEQEEENVEVVSGDEEVEENEESELLEEPQDDDDEENGEDNEEEDSKED